LPRILATLLVGAAAFALLLAGLLVAQRVHPAAPPHGSGGASLAAGGGHTKPPKVGTVPPTDTPSPPVATPPTAEPGDGGDPAQPTQPPSTSGDVAVRVTGATWDPSAPGEVLDLELGVRNDSPRSGNAGFASTRATLDGALLIAGSSDLGAAIPPGDAAVQVAVRMPSGLAERVWTAHEAAGESSRFDVDGDLHVAWDDGSSTSVPFTWSNGWTGGLAGLLAGLLAEQLARAVGVGMGRQPERHLGDDAGGDDRVVADDVRGEALVGDEGRPGGDERRPGAAPGR